MDQDVAAKGPEVPGYEGLVRVGAGGFSSVYRAYEPAFDRVVAIKVLNLTIAEPAAQRRFRRECQLMGRLGSHPHVITVFASGVLQDDRPYIVMEYLDGGTLSARAPLPESEVLRYGVLVGSALTSIHAADVIHRDVKPQNVLLSSYGHPVLGDFGVSDVVQQGGEISNPMALSPFYAAPETFNGQPSASSDQYSLAATLYALLAGRAPFQVSRDDVLPQILLRTISDPPPPLPDGTASPALVDAIERGLAKDATDRFPDVAALVRQLQAVQADAGLPVTAAVGGAGPVTPTHDEPGGAARIHTAPPLGGAPPGEVPTPPPPGPEEEARIDGTVAAAWPEAVAPAGHGAGGPIQFRRASDLYDPEATRMRVRGGGAAAPTPRVVLGGGAAVEGMGPAVAIPDGTGSDVPEDPAVPVPVAPEDGDVPTPGPERSTGDDGPSGRRSPALTVVAALAVVIALGVVLMAALDRGSDADDDVTTPTSGATSSGLVKPPVTASEPAEDIFDLWWEGSGSRSYYVVKLVDTQPGEVTPVQIVNGNTELVGVQERNGACFAVRDLGPTDDPSAQDDPNEFNTISDFFLNDEGCVNGATTDTVRE